MCLVVGTTSEAIVLDGTNTETNRTIYSVMCLFVLFEKIDYFLNTGIGRWQRGGVLILCDWLGKELLKLSIIFNIRGSFGLSNANVDCNNHLPSVPFGPFRDHRFGLFVLNQTDNDFEYMERKRHVSMGYDGEGHGARLEQ